MEVAGSSAWRAARLAFICDPTHGSGTFRAATSSMPRLPSCSIFRSLPLLSVLMLAMHRSLALLLVVGSVAFTSCRKDPDSLVVPSPAGTDSVLAETVVGGFDTIWELAWGPDNAIWVTERPGNISRVNPTTGAKTPVGQLSVAEIGEGGCWGWRFIPTSRSSPTSTDAYVLGSGGTRKSAGPHALNGTTLGAAEPLLENIPGAGNHNGARVAIGPGSLLYVSTGMASSEPLAQNRNSWLGKSLA